ncbi:MAG: hypothetical protein QM763_06710 [Agriterribacter sp.]
METRYFHLLYWANGLSFLRLGSGFFWQVSDRRQALHLPLKEIFHIDSPDSLPIVRELGFANLCFGLVGIVSLFIPQ